MMRLPFLETRFLNRQYVLRGRSSGATIYTLSKSFQIVQTTQELDSREENVVDTLYNGLLSSNRACLAQSITLTESTHPENAYSQDHCWRNLYNTANNFKKETIPTVFESVLELWFILQVEKDHWLFILCQTQGLSGLPGARKSTFLENMGKFLTTRGEKIAVLAVDPSSTTNGGIHFLMLHVHSLKLMIN